MKETHLIFDSYLGKTKPETIRKKENRCPFCDRDQLEEILDQDGSILLVKNKYPVLQDAFMTVLIETDDCHSDISIYPKDHLYKLFRFGMQHYFDFMSRNEYASVIWFRNYGPLSGGSIAHPHSQIIGFKNYDITNNIQSDHFIGLEIFRNQDIEMNLSTKPRVGFYEFNVILHNLDQIERFADYTQMAAHYLLNHFIFRCNSYNLFFYFFDGKVIAKIVPRFVTSPVYIGYSIPQVPNNLEEVVQHFKSLYL